jgi:hypothetical protein
MKNLSEINAIYKATRNGGAWDESLHPRHSAGSSQGGEFAPKGALSPADAEKLEQAPDAKRLAALPKEEFSKEVSGGLSLQMYRGVTHHGDTPGAPQWYATRPKTAVGYARGTGTVFIETLKMKRPYVASGRELLNATSVTIERLKGEGFDGMVTQWSGGIAVKSNPNPEREIWAVKF